MFQNSKRYASRRGIGISLFLAVLLIVAGAVSAGTAAAAAPPTVLSVENVGVTKLGVARGPVAGGAQVKILGSGFTAGSTVTVDGAAATGVTVDSSSQITAQMPPHASGNAHITVTTADGTSAIDSGNQFRYGIDAPSGLEVDATGETQVALRWTGSARNDVINYAIFRDSVQIATTDNLTMGFVDDSLAPGTPHTYFVRANFLAGSSSDSSTIPASTVSSAQPITSCSDQSLPSGHYYLAADLTDTTSSGPCLKFDSVSNVSLDCGLNSLPTYSASNTPSLSIEGVDHFLITRCDFAGDASTNIGNSGIAVVNSTRGSVYKNMFSMTDADFTSRGVWAMGSSKISVNSNTALNSSIILSTTTESEIRSNSFVSQPSQHTSGNTSADHGADSVVIANNTCDGGSSSSGGRGAPGSDDCILLEMGVTNSVVSGNALKNNYDAGIETTGYIAGCTLINNSIDSTYETAIGAYGSHGTSWFANHVISNLVTRSTSLFVFGTADPSAWPHPMYFAHNRFVGNSIDEPPASHPEWASAGSSVRTDTYPSGSAVAGDNEFIDNDFGVVRPAPSFTAGVVAVDSNNICDLGVHNSPRTLVCDGARSGSPSVTSVAPSNGIVHPGSTLTLAGSGFSSAKQITFWHGPSSPLNKTVPECASPGYHPYCFNASSDTEITFSAPAAMADGTASIRVTNANGTSAIAQAVQVDYSAPPTITLFNDSQVFSSTSFAGTFEVADTGRGLASVTCQLNDLTDGVNGSAAPCAPPDINYANLTDGHRYQVIVSATTSLGDAVTSAEQFSIDLGAPPPPTITGPTSGNTPGQPAFSATGEPGAMVLCGSVRSPRGWFQTRTTGNPFYMTTTVDGEYRFRCHQVSASGRQSPDTPEFVYVLDSVAPTVSITSPTEGQFVVGQSMSVSFSVTDATASSAVCSIDSETPVACSSPYEPASVSDGPHTVTVTATDATGNAASATVSFVRDATPPAGLTITGPPSPGADPNPHYAFDGVESGATVFCGIYANGVIDGYGQIPLENFYFSLGQDGTLRFKCYQVDSAGNEGPKSSDVEYVLDRVAPSVSITAPAEGQSVGGQSMSVSFSVTDAAATSAVCSIDSASPVACSSPYTPENVSDGPHTVTVTATDAAGNTASATVSFVRDTTPPAVLTITGPPSPGTNTEPHFAFSGVEPGATVNCGQVINGVPVGFGNIPWENFYASLSVDGAITFRCFQVDAAGNAGPMAPDVEYVLDRVAPSVAVTAPANGSYTGSSISASFTAIDTGGSGVVSKTCAIDSGTPIPCVSGQSLSGLSSGSHTLTVRATDGAGNVGSASTTFTAQGLPTITSVSPSTGSTAGGTSVTIAGTNLLGATGVAFGANQAASFTVNSATSITATSPAGASGVADVRVTTPSGTSAVVTGDRFTYGPPPTVTAVSPVSGPLAGGSTITLTGTNFTGATSVKFGSTAGTSLTVVSATSITVKTPAASAGVVDVTVTTPNGTSAITAADRFTYQGAPTVTAVSPVSGPLSGANSVTLTGTNFTGASAVKFGTTSATGIVVNSPTSITVTAPSRTAGQVDVTVTTPSGTSAVVAGDKYTYQSAPTVTAVSPSKGPLAGGGTVTITGSRFTGASSVKFGTTAATNVVVASSTTITATIPARAAGQVDITVTTPSGTSAVVTADRYTYVAAPTVTAVSPKSGPLAGNTTVTLTGTNFTGATGVKFGTVSGTSVTVVSATSITVRSPAGSAGAVDVTVTTPGGTSAVSAADKFTYQAAPTITAVSPSSGTRLGGTSVTLTGTNLVGASAVRFGTTSTTTFTVNSPTSITVTAPAHSIGQVDVTVTTPSGTSSVVAADKFTYN